MKYIAKRYCILSLDNIANGSFIISPVLKIWKLTAVHPLYIIQIECNQLNYGRLMFCLF